MIKFHCKKCGQKISVQDRYAGKPCKCPKCGSVFVVPDKSTIIDFHCESCGQKISVPIIHTGRKGKCPRCKNIVVAKPGIAASVASQNDLEVSKIDSKNSAYDLTLLKVPQNDEIQDLLISESSDSGEATEYGQELEEESAAEEIEPFAKRKLPWIIDIFLYPISVPGLVTLGIIIFISLLIDVVAWLLGTFVCFIWVISFFIRIVIGLYMYWYLAECIRDSAHGGLRAPETLGNAPGLGDMFWQALHIIGCLFIFVGPVGFYFIYAKRTDAIYWSLLAYAIFFFPMGLLSVIMFDSWRGLNPILLIGSIFSTFLPYCAMIGVFVLAGFLIAQKAPNTRGSPVLAFINYCVGIYLLMIVAHLLGWFYHRYEEELNWEV
jgi:DNA-directed RNA polymerase subunit RPC12/RpoP